MRLNEMKWEWNWNGNGMPGLWMAWLEAVRRNGREEREGMG